MHKCIPFDIVYENENNCPICKNALLNEEAEEISKNPNKFKTYNNFSEILEEKEKEQSKIYKLKITKTLKKFKMNKKSWI